MPCSSPSRTSNTRPGVILLQGPHARAVSEEIGHRVSWRPLLIRDPSHEQDNVLLAAHNITAAGNSVVLEVPETQYSHVTQALAHLAHVPTVFAYAPLQDVVRRDASTQQVLRNVIEFGHQLHPTTQKTAQSVGYLRRIDVDCAIKTLAARLTPESQAKVANVQRFLNMTFALDQHQAVHIQPRRANEL